MQRRTPIRPSLVALAVLCCAPGARAQEWAKKMFERTSHDFGVVARGAKVEYVFTIENLYEEEAHIESISSSCSCTTPQLDKPYLKTWEKARLTAVVNTRSSTGRKDATLKVLFDKPFRAEVQLQVYCFIRGDVVVQPGVVQLGSVPAGKGVRQKVAVSYAGRPDWRIERVDSANPSLLAQAVETSRGPTQINYDLWVTLRPEAPVGYIQDHLILVTNDYNAQAARIPVGVEGVVVAALSARPSPLMLGLVEVGKPAIRALSVQGVSPFRILAVRCDDPRFKATVPQEAKIVHAMPVTFIGSTTPGRIHAKLSIQTDLPSAAALEVPVQVQVVPKS